MGLLSSAMKKMLGARPAAPVAMPQVRVTGRDVVRCFANGNGVTVLLASGTVLLLSTDVVRVIGGALDDRGRRGRGRQVEAGRPTWWPAPWVTTLLLAAGAFLLYWWLITSEWLLR